MNNRIFPSILIIFFTVLSGAYTEETAILIQSPSPIKGIKFLSPNSLPAFQGEYKIDNRVVEVLFTREQIFIPEQWQPLMCGKKKVYRLPENEFFTVCYRDKQDFYLFFTFIEEIEEYEAWCSFVDKFIERFLILLGFIQYEVDIPFPAVLELP